MVCLSCTRRHPKIFDHFGEAWPVKSIVVEFQLLFIKLRDEIRAQLCPRKLVSHDQKMARASCGRARVSHYRCGVDYEAYLSTAKISI